jgi:hydrogenase 3 maturation protease
MENLVMCIGNRLGGDDAIGPYIADRLRREKQKKFIILDCGTVPENFTSVVKRCAPKNVVIVDAVDMGLSSGEIRRIPKDAIGNAHLSTHDIPISILVSYLQRWVKNIIIVGIQPKWMDGEMSEEVKKSGDELIELIKNMEVDKLKSLK